MGNYFLSVSKILGSDGVVSEGFSCPRLMVSGWVL